MKLGDKLKAIRKAKGLSLKQLSLLTEEQISISFLSDIENGRGKPSIDSLKVIASVLSTPISYFLEDTENSLFSGAIEDTDFIPVVELLKDFSDWNIEDKKELLYYLKAKRIIRDNK
jgi:transcriptional regulator with XRE-family HTH domain